MEGRDVREFQTADKGAVIWQEGFREDYEGVHPQKLVLYGYERGRLRCHFGIGQ